MCAQLADVDQAKPGVTTTPPSAACGNAASTGPNTKIDPSTMVAATRERS